MKKTRIFLGTLTLLLANFSVNAQEGFGTSTPAPSSVVDMVASDKGVLLPRVALTDIEDTVTISAPADALTVFNTATTTTGTNDVTPGYYYWSTNDNRWIRMIDKEADLRMVGSNNHVTQDAGVGANGTSLGFGSQNIAIGQESMGSIGDGNRNIGIGWYSLFDLNEGDGNIILGSNSGGGLVNGNNNIIIGNDKQTIYQVFDAGGAYSEPSNSLRIGDFLYGYQKQATSANTVVVGTLPNYVSETDNDFKETFNINKGSVWIKDIGTPAYTGDIATDKVVVATTTGVFKSVLASKIIQKTYSTTVQNTNKTWIDGTTPVYEVVAELTLGSNTNTITLPAVIPITAKLLSVRFVNQATNSISTNIVSYNATTRELVLGTPGSWTVYHPSGTYYIVVEYY